MNTRVAVIGGGVMGETMLSVLRRSGVTDIVLAEPRVDRAEELAKSFGVEVASTRDAVSGAAVVLVVVKPQVMDEALAEIGSALHPDALVVSLAAGVTIASIASHLPDSVGVARVMPNTPATIGQGMFGISTGPAVTDAQHRWLTELLGHGGTSVTVDEAQQNAVTAISGSGPAYLFYLAEAMIDAGLELGLDRPVAVRLVEQTLLGAARMLAEGETSAEELRRQVTSPNGTTHAALTTFDERGVGDGVRAGVSAAAERADELSGGRA